MKRVLLALVLLPLAALCRAQTMIARQFPFFYQLYSNEITDVYQDREGYVWIGTTDGISRYDGHRIVTFRNHYGTPALLAGSRVSFITDNSRYVWIGSNGGITLFDKTRRTFRRLSDPRLQKGFLSDIVADSDDHVWAAMGGSVFRCSPDGTTMRAYHPDPARGIYINHIFIDRQRRLWVLAYGGLFLLDRHSGKFRKYPVIGKSDSPFVMYQDSDNRLWIGTWGEGLWLFHPNQRGAECYERQSVKVSGTNEEDNIAFSIVQDDDMGYLWTLSYKELHALRMDNGHLTPVDISHVLDPHMMFTKITKDREGNLWLGSYDMGYNIFFNRSGINNYTLPQLKDRLGWDTNLLNLATDGNAVWMAQDRYGLLTYDVATGKLTDHHNPLGEIGLMKKSRRGGLWLATRNGSTIVKAERRGGEVVYPTKILLGKAIANPGRIRGLEEDTHGDIWILTDHNLFACRHGQEDAISVASGLPPFSAMTCDDSGKVWCIAGDRLYRLSLSQSNILAERQTTMNSVRQGERPTVCSIDGGGHLWLATSWGRVLRSDAGKHKFADIQIGSAIADGPVLAIMAGQQRVWIVTNKKIVLCGGKGNIVRVWRANEGRVQVKAFRQHAVCTDGKGGILAGGHGGFVDIRPSSADGKAIAPAFGVTDVTVDDVDIMYGGDSLNTASTIRLKPGDRNVRIFFSSLRYGLDPAYAVSYRLDGIDKDWVTATDNSSSAFYNELPAGKYHFLIRYQLPDGRWSAPADVLTVIQKPVFYKTTAAYIIYIVLSGLMVSLCVRNRRRLLALRERLRTMRKMYAGKVRLSMLDGHKAPATDHDSELMGKVVATIKEHVAENDFNIDKLAESLSMSRSTLYRRVNAATGVTPADIIRRVQLERACEMLEDNSENISEIAYAVGFTSPKYFAKCFKGEFGVTPSEYQRRHKTVQRDADK